jgi:hypothetical protein
MPGAKPTATQQCPASVVLLALQWLAQKGIRKLYLVGVDYRGGHARMRQPFNAPTRGRAGCRAEMFDRVVEQFRRAASHLQSQGGSLRNLSPNSALPFVEAATVKTLLEKGDE